jgi:uncharacterized membrane protein YhaH (DUF805 family)
MKKIKNFLNNRLSQKNFFAAIIIYFLLSRIITNIGAHTNGIMNILMQTLVPDLLGLIVVIFIIRRLHDINRSGFIILVPIILDFLVGLFIIFSGYNLPIASPFTILLTIYLFIKKGDAGANKYGEQPNPKLSFYSAILNK